MRGEGAIAAVLGVLSGGGIWHLLARFFGPERRRIEADTEAKIGRYHLEVIQALEDENRRLRDRLLSTERRIEALEQTVEKITLGELPPEFS